MATSSVAARSRNAAAKTALNALYKIQLNDQPITMSLKIGAPGQQGLSNVSFDNSPLLRNHNGAIKDLKVGTGNSVNGKFLKVRTVVTDIKGKPDDTAVDFTLTGGVNGTLTGKLRKTVLNDGESVVYDIKIFFFN